MNYKMIIGFLFMAWAAQASALAQRAPTGVKSFSYGDTAAAQPVFKLLAPTGGRSYRGGDTMTIQWTGGELSSGGGIYFSPDNGKNWAPAMVSGFRVNDTTRIWIVPYIKHQVDSALLQVAGEVTKKTFVIQASPLDSYESNNDFSSAYPIGIGDSVIKNATVLADDSALMVNEGIDTSHIDDDYYKISLSAGHLVSIGALPMAYLPGGGIYGDANPFPGSDWSYGGAFPYMELFNSSKIRVADGSWGYLSYVVPSDGIYYCKVSEKFAGLWSRYGLSLQSATVLCMEKTILDTNTFEQVQRNNVVIYKATLVTDTTKLRISLELYRKIQSTVTTMVFASEDIGQVADTKAKVKMIRIWGDDSAALMNAISSMTVRIPYNARDLNGNPAKSLVAYGQDNATLAWAPIACSIDSANSEIVTQSHSLSTLGIFVNAGTAVGSRAERAFAGAGIKAAYIPGKQCIGVNFVHSKSTNAELMLFDIQGKCRKKISHAGNSMIFWNVNGLANGKYFLKVKAGSYQATETILIVN